MKTISLALLLLLPLAFAPAAEANTPLVNITFRYGFGVDSDKSFSCALKVPAGASGVDVIHHAFAVKCINGYAREGATGSSRLTCLNNHCESDTIGLVGWVQYHDGVKQSAARLEKFSAGEGSMLSFAYAPGPR